MVCEPRQQDSTRISRSIAKSEVLHKAHEVDAKGHQGSEEVGVSRNADG